MAKNENLHKAKDAKKDEFYTQYEDIQNELNHYEQHFRGKTVLCNCDDPFESNFCKFFLRNFNYLGLKRLICTSYGTSPVVGQQLSLFDDENEPVAEIYEEGKEKVTYVKLDADKVAEIVEKHLKGGNIVTEYTIGAIQK